MRSFKPTPATVLALLALVFAMTGTGFAAAKLVSGDSLIKKNSLSGNRLKASSMPGARVYNTGTQSIASGVGTALTFTNADFNVGGTWSLSAPDRLTAKKAGVYVITASISWANDPAGVRDLSLKVNGATSIMTVSSAPVPSQNTAPIENCATTFRLRAGDYVQAIAFQTSGGALDSWNGAHETPTLSIDWIAP